MTWDITCVNLDINGVIMKLCIIQDELKIGSNQKGETFIWWPDGKKWLSMEEFKLCEIAPGTKLTLQIGIEKVKSHELSNLSHLPHASFNSNINYSLSPTPLTINKIELHNEQRQPEPQTTPTPNSDIISITDLFVGWAASLALVMSLIQHVHQKKKDIESNLCCNNNKMEISKFDMKLQKLETEIKTKSETDNKSIFAEILETQREIKNIKEDFNNSQENIQKLIDIIQLQNKNK